MAACVRRSALDVLPDRSFVTLGAGLAVSVLWTCVRLSASISHRLLCSSPAALAAAVAMLQKEPKEDTPLLHESFSSRGGSQHADSSPSPALKKRPSRLIADF